MKTKKLYIISLLALFSLYSCIETTLTNTIHADGSITRRIQIKDMDDRNFSSYANRVPYDSTWNVTDTFEIAEKNDTTWVRIVEKHFLNVEEINHTYASDSGCNKSYKREAKFEKKFHWFNTIYVYSENFGELLKHGIPIEKYLSKKELEYFYLPEDLVAERLKGADSTTVKQFVDSTETKVEDWVVRNLYSEWKEEFIILSAAKGKDSELREFLKNKDDDMFVKLKLLVDDSTSTNVDSTINLLLLEILGGQMYKDYKTEADSAINIVEKVVEKALSFTAYSVKSNMPGEMIATNGFIGDKAEIYWPLKMEYFLAAPYSMYAESKISNTWAWIVSGLFLLFVLTGLIVRILRKRSE